MTQLLKQLHSCIQNPGTQLRLFATAVNSHLLLILWEYGNIFSDFFFFLSNATR